MKILLCCLRWDEVNIIKKAPAQKNRGLDRLAAAYSPTLLCSTIGAGGLNFSVRNGKRWNPAAKTT